MVIKIDKKVCPQNFALSGEKPRPSNILTGFKLLQKRFSPKGGTLFALIQAPPFAVKSERTRPAPYGAGRVPVRNIGGEGFKFAFANY